MALEGIRRSVSSVDPVGTKTTAAAKPAAKDFSAEMKRIAAHAESVETLKNGAKLYHLANGREVEQVPGKSPYVTKKGTLPTTAATTPAATTTTTTPAATTTTTPATTTTTPPTTTTTPSTTTPTTGTSGTSTSK